MNLGVPADPAAVGRVLALHALRAADANEVGGTAAHFGELISAGLPVPPGFVLLPAICVQAMRAPSTRERLAEIHQRCAATVSPAAAPRPRCSPRWCCRCCSRSIMGRTRPG